MVIIDTSVWIAFFKPAHSPEKSSVTHLLDEERVMLVGVVLSELIQGTRSAQDRKQLQDTLIALPYLEMTPHTWLLTGEMGAQLRGKGLTVGIPDLIVAALAQEFDCQVYSLDSDFRRIPNLSLYTPPT
jgi:predicted nucleic acid-binding protein